MINPYRAWCQPNGIHRLSNPIFLPIRTLLISAVRLPLHACSLVLVIVKLKYTLV
ncbi:hypothetical protein [Paenibacillus sp. 2TAB26]|uniref:hypothetical protein n=1 Tax=Paenibacillus sp. 2TAB26 TaxID=3233005 RepID=UPI003F95BF13